MAFGRYEYRRLGFLDDPNTCDISVLRYFVNANRGKFLDAKNGTPFEELDNIYRKRECESYLYRDKKFNISND